MTTKTRASAAPQPVTSPLMLWVRQLMVFALVAVCAACGAGDAGHGLTPTAPSHPEMLVQVQTGGLFFPGDSVMGHVAVLAVENGFSGYWPVTGATWVSSDTSVATVSVDGTITAVAPGTARLTATYQGNSDVAWVTVLRDSDLVGLELSCPVTLGIGLTSVCLAVARLRSGMGANAAPAWSSSHPDVLSIDWRGVVSARSAGQAVVSATYRSQRASVPLSVTSTDVLHVGQSFAEQGDFRPGNPVTLIVLGDYGVASADSGRLSVRIADQGGVIMTTTPLSVARGGGTFAIRCAFTIPQNSTQLCPTVLLEIGPITLSEPGTCRPVNR